MPTTAEHNPPRSSRADRCRGAVRALRGRLRAQAGLTLIELLITCSMLTVVLSATLSTLDRATRVARGDMERATALGDGQVGLDRMTRELRSAYKVVGPTSAGTSNYLDVVMLKRPGTDAVARRVLYRCDQPSPTTSGYRACLRYEGAANDAAAAGTAPAGSTGQLVVDRLVNGTAASPVFTLTTPAGGSRPTQVAENVEVPAKGTRSTGYSQSVVLRDGFYLRNLDVSW